MVILLPALLLKFETKLCACFAMMVIQLLRRVSIGVFIELA